MLLGCIGRREAGAHPARTGVEPGVARRATTPSRLPSGARALAACGPRTLDRVRHTQVVFVEREAHRLVYVRKRRDLAFGFLTMSGGRDRTPGAGRRARRGGWRGGCRRRVSHTSPMSLSCDHGPRWSAPIAAPSTQIPVIRLCVSRHLQMWPCQIQLRCGSFRRHAASFAHCALRRSARHVRSQPSPLSAWRSTYSREE